MAHLPYGVVVAEIDKNFHPSDPRHLAVKTFEYDELYAAWAFADSKVASKEVLAVTIEGPGGAVVFDYAAKA